ncbi:MAG: Phage integrase family protein [Parcubacteria group bacterium Gr01-1014_17]|nr:MAG: Phage integrase family protein [Parcubacteria group bacterium Gr01-1014_17]
MITHYLYQIECLDRIEAHRSNGGQTGLVVMASGLGKTVMVAFDAKRHFQNGGGRLLYLCHMTDILYQARSEFEVIIDSGKSFGFFHGKEKSMQEVDCLFSTFETMANWLDMFEPSEFDYIIVDESHHSHAETYLRTIQYFRPKFLLGMTATPDRLDRKDIRNIYGEPLFNLPLEEALGNGYLTPVDYRILTDEISLEEILKTPDQRWSFHALNRRIFIPQRDEEIAKIVASHITDMRHPKTIVFCPSVRHCDHLVKFMPDSLAIHSYIPDKERDVRLEMFRQDMLDTVLTVDCFNEGIDIPRANVIVFLRSTASKTILLQQLGRGLRKSIGKDKVVVLDFVGNLRRIQHIEEIVRAAEEFMPTEKVAVRGVKPIVAPPITLEVGTVRFNEEMIPFTELLGRVLRQEPYPTWQEASAATIKLGITSTHIYKRQRCYKKDPRLPHNPRTYAGWPGWDRFLNRARKEYYTTWQEAAAVVQPLKLSNRKEYRRLPGDIDKRLPHRPDLVYLDFPGWGMFLRGRQKPYATYQEASGAARKLSLKTNTEYKQRYKEDPRLPAHPNEEYQKEWEGWNAFLGTRSKMGYYPTWQEAAKASQKFKFEHGNDYKRRCKSCDQRLPSAPWYVYRDFPGWYKFFGVEKPRRYNTYTQASKAARKLGVQSSTEYKNRRKEDPLLPGSPHEVYKNQWKGWNAFLHTPSLLDYYPTCAEAMDAARRHRFRGCKEYQRRCKSCDLRLPVTPYYVYSDFPGWAKYFGRE